MNKKGQMKIQQMAFMLIAVTLLFVFVGIFFIKIMLSEVNQSAESLEEKNALLTVARLADSPEFSCGSAFGTSKSNCVDFDKVMSLSEISDRYSSFWGVEGINIRRIYPAIEGVCTTENYPDCGEINLFSEEGVGVSNFISLCRKSEQGNVCDVARITVYYGGGDE
ncbi:MAG: hypothetical protein KKC19_00115 [Nanoarchaeota archaeon]|nr:hypothetical protein [Nanoarchaeota archaeon]